MSSLTRKVIMGGDRYPYTSLKDAHTSLKDGGVGVEPDTCQECCEREKRLAGDPSCLRYRSRSYNIAPVAQCV